jgi:hypothetical protein
VKAPTVCLLETPVSPEVSRHTVSAWIERLEHAFYLGEAMGIQMEMCKKERGLRTENMEFCGMILMAGFSLLYGCPVI